MGAMRGELDAIIPAHDVLWSGMWLLWGRHAVERFRFGKTGGGGETTSKKPSW